MAKNARNITLNAAINASATLTAGQKAQLVKIVEIIDGTEGGGGGGLDYDLDRIQKIMAATTW